MAIIILRHSSTSGKVPTAAQLQVGEVTVNTADGVMHTKHSDGSIKELFPSNVILTRLLNVDGAGSSLDADLLDGQQGSWYAPLASPAFTGIPSAPTAAAGTNNTQLATTAFVQAEIANDAPTKTGAGASGTWNINISGNAASAGSAATVTNGVYTTGNQTIAGIKTFSSSPILPNPPTGTVSNAAATTSFVHESKKVQYWAGASKYYNTVYYASKTVALSVLVEGTYMNGIDIAVGSTADSVITVIGQFGDDLNNYTKLASMWVLIPAGMYYQVRPRRDYAFETIVIIEYPFGE